MGILEDNKVVNYLYEVAFFLVVSYAFFGGLSYYILFSNGPYIMVSFGIISYCFWMLFYLLRLVYKLKTVDYLDKVIKHGLPK